MPELVATHVPSLYGGHGVLCRAFIHRLPNEMLMYIFEEAAAAVPNIVECMDGNHWRTPVRLSQVCRRWRTVALQNPMLWSKLKFVGMDQAAHFLAHSGARPMEIAITEPLPSPIPRPLIAALHSSAPRWDQVIWADYSRWSTENLLAILSYSGCFDILQKLILLSGSPLCSRSPLVLSNVDRYPALTTLVLHRIHLGALPPGRKPRLDSLKLDHSPPHTIAQLLSFLSQAPSLTELRFQDTRLVIDARPATTDSETSGVNAEGGLAYPTVRPLRMELLTEISWDDAPYSEFWHFFAYLDAPELRRVSIKMGEEPLFEFSTHLPDLSQPPIPSNSVISLDGLWELYLSFRTPEQLLNNTFAHLALPELWTLGIDLATEPGDEGADGSPEYLPQMSFPHYSAILRADQLQNIGELHLTGFSFCNTEVKALLDATPALEQLSLKDSECAYEFVCALTPEQCHICRLEELQAQEDGVFVDAHRDPVWRCPKLWSLSVIGCADIEMKSLLSLLSVRLTGARPWLGDTSGDHRKIDGPRPVVLSKLHYERCREVSEEGWECIRWGQSRLGFDITA